MFEIYSACSNALGTQAPPVAISDQHSYLVTEIEELAPTVRPAVYLVHGDADPDVSVRESDTVSDLLQAAEWAYNDEWFYQRIPDATHEWQTQYNQDMWDFLYQNPNDEVAQ